MDKKDLIKELWSIANIITGFSIIQSLAFALALGKDLAGLQTQTPQVKKAISIICFIFFGFYSFGVFRCYVLSMQLDNAYESVWLQITLGRVGGILVFTLVPIFGLFAPNFFHKSGATASQS